MPRTRQGLPGFLRRTIRTDYDVDERSADSGSVGNSAHRRDDGVGAGSNNTNNNNRRQDNNNSTGNNNDIVVSSSIAIDSTTQQPPSSLVAPTAALSLDSPTTKNNAKASEPTPTNNNNDDVALPDESESSASAAAAPPPDDSSRHSQPKQQQIQRQSTPPTPTKPASDTNFYVPSVIRTGEPERKTYKETQFDKVIGSDILNVPDLRRLAWNGIPTCYRSQGWKFMLGYLPANAGRRQDTIRRKRREYNTAIQQHYDIHEDSRTTQEQETLRQVLVDVPRTQPDVPLFRNERIRKMLSRLLYIWAMRHPASSYVQGINDLATPFIAVFLSDHYNHQDVLDGNVMLHLSQEKLDQIEADCYWCLTNLLAGIQDHYTSDQPGVQRMVLRLEELVNRIDAALCDHLRQMGIEFMQFAFKWMNCLLLREFNLRCVIRLWDTYISEMNGFEDFHVYVCAAFLCQFSTELQNMDFDNLFGFMQSMPTENWGDTEIEMLLSQAYVLSTLFGGSEAHLTSSVSARF